MKNRRLKDNFDRSSLLEDMIISFKDRRVNNLIARGAMIGSVITIASMYFIAKFMVKIGVIVFTYQH
jgi:hypothetical protein